MEVAPRLPEAKRKDTMSDLAAMNGSGVREVKSAVRTIEVLEYLAQRQANPARLKEISDAVGAPRSSTYAARA